jgi:hypothetical protein
MSDNQIKISVNLDSKELDQKFSGIIKKLQQIREEASKAGTAIDKATGGSGVGPQSRAGGAANQAVNAQQSDKSLQALQKTLSSLSDRTDTFDKSLKNLSKTLDDLSNKAQSAATATTQAATAQQTTQQQTTAAGGGVGGTPGPGGPGGLGGPGKIPQQLSSLAKILGVTGTAIATGGQLYKQVLTYPERITQKEATIANTVSEMNRLQMQRRGYEMALFGPERTRALEKASTRVGTEKAADVTGLMGTVLGGAALGAAGGSFLGGIGAVPGAVVGGLTAFGGSMLNDRKRSMLFNREAYQKEMGSVFAGTYQEQLAAERAKSYEKDLASQFFQKESGRFKTLQRGFGLSDEELFKGDQSLFRKAAKAGYDMDTITQAMQGISAAGGSTKVAAGGAQIASQLQRNLDLTNAPQLLGKISGATGMNEIRSKDEIIRMYAEATRIGLDTSETRDFLQAAADIGYKTGGNLENITNLLSAGVQGAGLEGPRGVEAAQTALEKIRQQTSEMGGLTGQYGISELRSEEITGALGGQGLDMGETAYLLGTDVTKISDEYIQNLLEKRGQKAGPEEIKALKERIIKGKTRAVLRTDEQEKALEEYQKVQEGSGVYSPQAKREARFAAEEQFGLVQGTGFLGLGEPEKGAVIGQMGVGLGGLVSPDLTQKIEETKKRYGTETGRMIDQEEKSAAMDAAGSLLNLKEQAEALTAAFKANVAAGENAAKAAQNLGNLADILGKIKDPNEVSKIQNFLTNPQSSSIPEAAPVSFTPMGPK